MCGILGVLTTRDRTLSVGEPDLRRMRDRLAHRGPDDAGLWIRPDGALAHRRLAILDPERGGQPLVLPRPGRGPLALTFNGEIYNHLDLRPELDAERPFATTCDAETLAFALSRWGPADACRRLRGMYAFGAWSPDEGTLTLARDPLGIKPLYYAIVDVDGGAELVFASEPVGILDHPHASVQPDWVTVSAYLTTIRTTLDDRSLFAGVHVVQPGEILTFDLKGDRPRLIERDVIEPPLGVDEDPLVDLDEAIARTRAGLESSVQAHLLSDAPLCSLLSGGLDSTIIATLAHDAMADLRTYAIGAADDADGDRVFAEEAAAELGVAHTGVTMDESLFHELWPQMIGAMLSPLSTPNETAIHAICRVLSKDAKVSLSGEGADELFAGYGPPLLAAARYRTHPFDEHGDALSPGSFYLQTVSWTPVGAKLSVLTPAVASAASCDAVLVDSIDRAYETCGGDGGGLATFLHLQRRLNLTGLLQRLDSASMLASVEGRTPFADIEIARLAASFPMRAHIDLDAAAAATDDGGGAAVATAVETKRLLRAAFADRLPSSIVRRPKASFPLPFQTWMASHTAVLRESPTAREVFTPGVIDLVAADPTSNWMVAWPILNIAYWLRAIWD